MALKKVGYQKFDLDPVALTGLEIGETVSGYFTGTMKSVHANGADNMIFRDKDTGESFAVYTAGNVRYLLQDGAVELGFYTEITRIDDKMVKGKKSSQYDVQQDSEDKNPWEDGGAADISKSNGADKSASSEGTDSKQLI